MTAYLMRRDPFLQHANGAQSIVSVTGQVHDLERAAACLCTFFGTEAVAVSDSPVRGALSNGQTIILHRIEGSNQEGLGGIALKVDDLSRTAAVLSRHEVPLQTIKTRTGALVAPKMACGVMIELVER